MFDELREQASQGFELPEPAEEEDVYSFKEEKHSRRRGPLLGMTPAQRFIIVSLLFMMSCLLSSFCLIVTGKIWF